MVRCAICGSTNVYKDGYTTGGTQRYRCRDCGEKRTQNPRISFKSTDIKCPRCANTNIGKRGHTRNGNQRYWCKECGRTFVLGYPEPVLSEKDKKLILFYHNNFGVSIQSLAENLHHGQATISKFIKESKNEN